MSRLKELIQELCPNGVEYREIEEVANYEQPSKYIVKSTKYDDSYVTPVLTAGQTFILGYTNETDGIFQASKDNPVIIFDDFTGAFKWVDFPFKVKSSAMKIITTKENNMPLRYLFHIMGYLGFKSDEHKRLWISIYSRLEIPVPPLEVQREIVRILDSFTLLTAELTARKKQYEYYRDMLLTFDVRGGATSDVAWRTLGEVCNVVSGGTPSKKEINYWANGTIKWLGSTVCQNQKTVTEVTDYITENGLKNSSAKMMNEETTLIALVGATIGKVAFLPFKAAINQNIAGVYPKDLKQLNPSYVYYACTTLYPKFLALTQGSKLAMANMSFVRSLPIAVPPMKVQERLVHVLDNFDTICSDLNIGLPAEIEARQKQYEFYRDKLLSFKQL